MKRNQLLGVILTLAMVLTLMAPLAVRAAEPPTLADPGFEGDIWNDKIWSYWLPDGESWSGKQVEQFSYSSDPYMTPPADGGSSCVKFYLESSGSFYFTQVLKDVPAGKYTLSCTSMGEEETVAVKFGDELGTAVQTDSGYNNWTASSGEFTLTEDCAELIVGVYVTCSAGGWGYVDNLTLTAQQEEEEETFAEITLANGDFETGDTTNWVVSGYSEVAEDQWAKNNGSNALSLWLSDSESAAGSASYSVELTAGKYYFTFDLAGAAMDSGLKYAITAGDSTLVSGSESYTTTGWDVWQTYTADTFELTEDGLVTFTLSGTQPAGYFGDLDNLKLYGTGAAVEKDPESVEANIYVPYIKGTGGDFMRGMDVSSVLSILNSGAAFKDYEGNTLDGQGFFNLLAASGVNWIRLRVWNDPFDSNGNGYGGGNCDLEAAKVMGRWATNAGMKVLIDFHYSDFWADPGKQQAPKAWAGYTVDQKAAAIEEYTRTSLTALLNAGVNVGMVQVGNETTGSMCGVSAWEDRCKLFSAGAEAVRAVSGDILVAIHFTNPERSGNYANFAKQLDTYHVDYDVFASSYYPYWHGTLSNLTSVLKQVADTYGKQVIVAETSWAYTLEDGDGHDNTVRKNNNDTGNYDYSAQGQATELTDVVKAVKAVGEAGVGVFYWEPAWIPVQVYDGTEETLDENKALWEKHGSGWASSYAVEYDPSDAGVWYGGSAWDNQALFDFRGNPLDSLKTYLYMQTGTSGFQIYVTNVESPELVYTVGDTLVLPETLTVSYSYGSDQEVTVTWDEASVAAVDMNTPGTYTVTGKLESGEEATCTVVVKAENLLLNPGFEDADMSMYTSSQAYAKRTTDDPHSEKYSLHFYNSGLVDFTTEQTVTLQPGHYVFSLYGQGGNVGEEARTYAYVKIGDTLYTEDFSLTGWAIWVNPTIEFDVAEETEVVVGVNVTASQNGAWGTFDDWYLCGNTDPVHSGGSADCCHKAKCGACGVEYGDVNKENHSGGTEVRGIVEATTEIEGYTGDTYCLGCGNLIARGKVTDRLKAPEETTGPTGETTEPTTEPATESTTGSTTGSTGGSDDKESGTTTPSTGDAVPVMLLMLLMIVSVGMALTLKRRGKV